MPPTIANIREIVKKYPKIIACTLSYLTTIGVLVFERRRITKYLNLKRVEKQDKRQPPEYIYIKNHSYHEWMRKIKEKEEDEKKWISVRRNPIGKWWKGVKHSVAWRLLNIAQNGSQYERMKAVRQMALLDHLKDWDFRHLAQLCDARTAVSLARSRADIRWFAPVHMRSIVKHPKVLLGQMRELFNRMRPNGCIDHFFDKNFPEPDLGGVNDKLYKQKNVPLALEETMLLKDIVDFLHHITEDVAAATKLVEKGGLKNLMELCKLFALDNEMLSTLCKVLANCALGTNCVDHFYATGWITILAEWQKSPDLRLQVISAKTMANLDYDDPNRNEYPPNVYPLHPRKRTSAKPKADIVFIHGLLGGAFITWRQKHRNHSTELGLYGKNAFYTNEAYDAFLVKKRVEERKQLCSHDLLAVENDDSKDILKAAEKAPHKSLEISDDATKEFVEELQSECELDSEWEVVHPDIPISADEDSEGEFSVPGNEWINEDNSEDYTNCWPMEWLPDDYPDVRIIGIDYKSSITEWSSNYTKHCPCEKNQGHINVRAEALLKQLALSDVGNKRPVVWIGHSMGGIITKAILLQALTDPDPKKRQLSKNTSGIVFLGTPHRGSPFAKWRQHMQVILSLSIEVKEMEENSPMLSTMHESFEEALQKDLCNVKIVSISEGSPTMLTTFKIPLHIVNEESARINYGDFYVMKDDHLNLSKPIFRQSFLYKRILQVIEETING